VQLYLSLKGIKKYNYLLAKTDFLWTSRDKLIAIFEVNNTNSFFNTNFSIFGHQNPGPGS
jgi:hypothetical protein